MNRVIEMVSNWLSIQEIEDDIDLQREQFSTDMTEGLTVLEEKITKIQDTHNTLQKESAEYQEQAMKVLEESKKIVDENCVLVKALSGKIDLIKNIILLNPENTQDIQKIIDEIQNDIMEQEKNILKYEREREQDRKRFFEIDREGLTHE